MDQTIGLHLERDLSPHIAKVRQLICERVRLQGFAANAEIVLPIWLGTNA